MALNVKAELERTGLERIVEVILWCQDHATGAGIPSHLRSSELQPACDASDRYGLQENGTQIVNELAIKRKLHVRLSLSTISLPTDEGRLLAYQPDAGFMDGLAEHASEGFFDRWDAPPWDTWILYSMQGHIAHIPHGAVEEGILISWVPPSLLKLAQCGVDAHPYEAIKWLDEVEVL